MVKGKGLKINIKDREIGGSKCFLRRGGLALSDRLCAQGGVADYRTSTRITELSPDFPQKRIHSRCIHRAGIRHHTNQGSLASSSPWPSPATGSKTSFSSCRPSTTVSKWSTTNWPMRRQRCSVTMSCTMRCPMG
ncbi:uncharacterized protein LOC115185006 isoform X1 [Salmo trutta]|uniref:uncharacterized protein LOC115185006 isoform X1 n=1 Tax=Salmo trutta TaxID=8032 RepID=UPI0011318CF1|nr:uncharacterized protein LOC115185006 isoform X1 [Salmo trutta]